MNRRFSILFITLVVVTSAYIWRKPLTAFGVRFGFKYFSQHFLGEQIQFDSFKLEDHQIVLKEAKLGSKARALSRGGVYIETDEVVIGYDMNLLKRTLKIDLKVDKPSIWVTKTNHFKPSLNQFFKHKEGLIKVETSFAMTGGEIELCDKTSYHEPFVQKITFDAKNHIDEQNLSQILISLKQDEASCEGIVALHECEIDYNLNLNKVPISELQDMLYFWISSKSKQERSFNCFGGSIHGIVNLSFAENDMPMLRANLRLNEVCFDDKKTLLSMYIPEAIVDLQTTQHTLGKDSCSIKDLVESWLDTFEGDITIPIGASVLYQTEEIKILHSQNMVGRIAFENKQPIKIDLDGSIISNGKESVVSLHGSGFLNTLQGDLEILLQNPLKEPVTILCSLLSNGKNKHIFSSKITHLTQDEADIIQQLLSPFYPKVRIPRIKNGALDATINCQLTNFTPGYFSVDHFKITNGSLTDLNFIQNLKNLNAQGSIRFNLQDPNLFKTFDAEIEYQAEQLVSGSYQIDQIEGKCQFASGKLKLWNNVAFCSNIKGELDWNYNQSKDPLTLTFKGKGEDFCSIAPKLVKEGYSRFFKEEDVDVQLKGNVDQNRLILTGRAIVDKDQEISFGFDILSNHPKRIQSENEALFWRYFISPLRTMPTLGYFSEQWRREGRQFLVQNGWFNSDQVPIEKYVSPIIFGNTTIVLSGFANIEGEFNEQGLNISYDKYHLNLDHPTYSVWINAHDQSECGHHYFNFAKKTHFGNLKVENAEFFLKQQQLSFSQLEGCLEITPESLFVSSLKGNTEGINLTSNLDMRFAKNGDFKLKLKFYECHGMVEDFKPFFSSLGYSFAKHLPLDAKLVIDPKKTFFELEKKEKIASSVQLHGAIEQGTLPFMWQQPLTGISFKFAFDSQTQSLEVQDFVGEWKSHRNQNYSLYSNYLKINLFNDDPCHFDIRVKDAYKDCAHLLGRFYLNVAQKKPNLKIILDQKNNHIGGIDLTNVYFALDEKFHLDYLNVNFACNLNSLHQDIFLAQNVIPKISGSTLAGLKWLSPEGEVCGQWVYELNQNKHQFFIWGDQVGFKQSSKGFFQVKGHKLESQTVIEDFTYHDLKGSCKLEEKPLCCFIHECKLFTGQDFDLQLSGLYSKIFNSFQIDIKKLDCDLARLKNTFLLSSFESLKSSSGKLDLIGKLEGGYYKRDFNYGVELHGGAYNVRVQDYQLRNGNIAALVEGNSKIVKLKNFEGVLDEVYGQPIDLKFAVKDLEIGREQAGYKLEQLGFSIPVEQLSSLQSLLSKYKQIEIPSSLLQLKKNGDIRGKIKLDSQKKPYEIILNLECGKYLFAQKEYEIIQSELRYSPGHIDARVQALLYNRPYDVRYLQDQSQPGAFNIYINDQSIHDVGDKGLKIHCQRTTVDTIIKSIEGSMAGLRWDFVHRPEKETPSSYVLMGQLQIQGDELVEALPSFLKDKLRKLHMGSGYFLTGQLTVPKANFKDFVFEGLFGGQDCGLLGFEFKSLSSIIRFSKNGMIIKDFKLSDLSGELVIDNIQVKGTHFNIPKIALKEFKPSLLHRSEQEGAIKHKPLIIEKLEISNLKGDLADLNSVKGDGYFAFQKSPKKQASLLDIPVHLISKLGLDLTMLNPVEGKVIFEFKDQKIIFTKLIDVYSHDKHCHFTLAKQPGLSYMDFNGNLNIKIKMKQYVLLKFTEPFIISVQGSYEAPRYSFMKKKMVVDVPERLGL